MCPRIFHFITGYIFDNWLHLVRTKAASAWWQLKWSKINAGSVLQKYFDHRLMWYLIVLQSNSKKV